MQKQLLSAWNGNYLNTEIEMWMRSIIETTEEVKHVFCGEQNIHKKRLEEILGFFNQDSNRKTCEAILSNPAAALVSAKIIIDISFLYMIIFLCYVCSTRATTAQNRF